MIPPPSPDLLERLTWLTRDLVSIPSTENRPQDRSRCFALLRNHLDSLPGVQMREYESNGFGSLVVLPSEVEVPAILFVAHLDVIEHPDPAVYTTIVQDGRIIGPGSGDMKGQGAIMLEIFRNLQRRHPGISVGLAYTSDEERGGDDGVRFLFEDAGLRCGLAIIPDGGSINDVTVQEKGILRIHLHCQGKASHAARPWLVPNPVATLAQAIVNIEAAFALLKPQEDPSGDHWYPTCAPTIFRTANETINCIPAEAEAWLDIRFPEPFTKEHLLGLVRQYSGPTVVVKAERHAPPTHLGSSDLYISVTERLTGRPVNRVRASGGSDARFISQFGIPVVLSRPHVGNLHGTDEWIDIASMGLYYQICERFVLEHLNLM